MHTHVSALDAFVVALYLLIILAAFRVIQGRLAQSDNPTAVAAGEALAFIA